MQVDVFRISDIDFPTDSRLFVSGTTEYRIGQAKYSVVNSNQPTSYQKNTPDSLEFVQAKFL